jgi:hypothetical protein
MATAGDHTEMMRREILPKDGNGYVDQFWSGMFGTLCTFAQTEARLVWMRYSAFLIVHGLLFNFVKDNLSNHLVLLVAGIVGLVICGVWAFLNHCGWANQNLCLWHASRLKFRMDNLTLPTDAFAGAQPPSPGDSIYWTAQTLPIVLGIVDCIGIYEGADKITANNTWRLGIALLAGAISVGLVAILCRSVQGKPTFA